MKINKQELQEALRIVKPGLGDEKILEQSTSFAFVDNKVVTYNDQISISHPVENLQLTGAIRAEELYQLLARIKKDEFDLEITDNQVLIKAGRINAGLQLQKEIKLPLLDEKKKWKELPEKFNECLSFAWPVCTTDMSRLVLTCINITKDGQVQSSDGFRILQQTLSDEMPVADFLLPAATVKTVVFLNPNKIAVTKGWVHFQTTQGTVISCRSVEGEYPDVVKHFITKGKRVTLPKRIVDILDRAKVFTKQDFQLDERITLELEQELLTVKSRSETGWFEEQSKLTYSGKKITFDIAPILFEHILKQTQTFLLDENRVKFSGDNWEYMVMLLNNE